MGHTLLSLLGFFLLNLLYRGQAQDRNVILESPASTLFEGESVTLLCRHRAQREENAAFFRDGSLITTDRNHQSPLMANNTVQVMSDRSSYRCKFGDEESEPIKLRPEPKPKAQLRDIFPGGGNVTLTCSVGPSSASGWRYFWYKKEKTSEPLKRQDVFLTNDQISVSRGGVYWCRGGRGDPVYYTEYSDAVVTNRAVVTLRPNWPEMYSGETITCEIKDGGDYEWDYIWMTPWSYEPQTSDPKYTLTSQSGDYRCMGRLKGEMSSTRWSDVLKLKVSDNTPEPVLTVSPSWPSPGASVTLNCRVDHPSAGWSFYWYKAAPQLSGNSYSYELLPGSENGTEQDLFIIDGQTHTAGYYCRAGRGDPVFYTSYSKPVFVWSGDLNSAASLTVSPDSVQHFTKTSVSLSCEGNSTEWRVMRFYEPRYLRHCSSWGTMAGSTCTITRSWLSGVYWCESETGEFSNAVNITMKYGDIILVSPVRPVAEGLPVTLSCKFKTENVYNLDFYRNDKLIQNDTRRELTISAVSKSDEGFYKCKRRDSADGRTSPESWFSVKYTPEPVLTVSPSWPSPGASVTLNCRVDHPSAGWSFYWYKAVPQKSGNSYSYELLPGSEKGTEQDLFIIDGQTHTAGYVCRAGRGDPVFYTSYSKPKFVWSGDLNSAASLTVSPDSVQHFTKTSVSLSCEGNSTEWRVMRFYEPDYLYPCSSWGTMTGSTCTITRSWLSGVFWCESETGQFSNAVNITNEYDDIILVSSVRPVSEGLPVTLSCKLKTQTVYNVDFYRNDKLIQNDTRRELIISAVSKSDEGFYKCKRRDSADGRTSPESWFSVKSASGPGTFPVLLIVGLLCGVSLIILLLLFLYLYRKSKDSCYSRSQRTNQSPATDHMINQDETNQRENGSVLQDNACLYESVTGPEEPANDESMDVTYSVLELKNISKKGKKNEPEDCVYSDVQMASAAAGLMKYYSPFKICVGLHAAC
ncbi:hypothetical protein NQZ68_038808 [Dissostichus eleginoides]|nr:hypothetical protein NQZ68_038808 [Dissostichus eleginoides]